MPAAFKKIAANNFVQEYTCCMAQWELCTTLYFHERNVRKLCDGIVQAKGEG